MKIKRRFLVLFILVLVIVPLFNMGGCYEGAASIHKKLKKQYEEDYGTWNWEKRFNMMVALDITAALGDVEFNWLDLPVEKIQVNDSAGADAGGASGGGGCSDGR
jgi:hypothetical protein